MAIDKSIDSAQLDADLASVANAIRTKGGTSAQLAFPAEFVSAIEAIETGGGGDTYKKTTYTVASTASINTALRNANIHLVTQDEILIWNIKGTHIQSSGSVGGKWGIIFVQNGEVVSSYGTGTSSYYQRMSSVEAPDSSAPGAASSWTPTVTNGFYHATGTTFHVGGGNTIDFIQIPYKIGWNV